MLTKTQVKIILALLDNKGHAGCELSDSLRMKDSNLNPLLKDLEEMKIIYKGDIRSSRRQHKNKGTYGEIPYYLCQDLDNFRILIREISGADKPYDSGFLLEIIDNSKYLKMMKELFGENLSEIINEELSKGDSPFADPFFAQIIEPELVEELFCNLERLCNS